MSIQDNKYLFIKIPQALKFVGLVGGVWAILTILATTLAYIPEHPEFSICKTYLSDMGDTPSWPQIFFNSGMLIAVPIRYLILVLLVLRLRSLGAGRTLSIAVLVIGFASTSGTALMAAAPFSVAPTVHKAGIGFYFLGVILLQFLIFIQEWKLKEVPRVLPLLSLMMVVLYFVFATLMILYEQGMVSRNTPVIWEWLAIITSIGWMLAQSLLLGKSNADP